jgi:hypothetical protein
MQNFLKKYILLFLPLATYSQTALYIADSLFVQKQYQQALTLYSLQTDSTLKKKPNLLLKMAFIAENSGDYTQSLYFLNQYAQLKPDLAIYRKIYSLASQNNLKGYDQAGKNLLWVRYEVYYGVLTCLVCIFSLLIFISLLVRYRKKKIIPYRRNISLILFLVFLLWFFNFPQNTKYAIVRYDDTALRTAPGAGSQIKTFLGKGHRLPVSENQDVWVLVRWEGENAYVHRKNVWQLR